MRVFVRTAAAVLFASTLPALPAAAQPAEQSAASSALHIVWEVKNRFRLFRNERDFQRHVAAHRGDGVLAAEQRLALASDGRGWAKDVLGHLCVDGTGKIVETCQRDGEKENYLSPEDHRVGVRLAGPVPAGATCAWNFDDSTPPPQQVTVPCTEEVRLRVRHGRTTVATVAITRADNSVDNAAADIIVQDLLIAGLGDSVAAGEGNPDRPVALADDGFCFRRFLGSGEYFRPSRAGYNGNKACDDAAGGPEAAEAEPRLGAPRRALGVRRLPPFALRISGAHRAGVGGREPARRGDVPSPRLQRRHHGRRHFQGTARPRVPSDRQLRRLGARPDHAAS